MAYSAFKWDKQMSLEEKRVAWNVLEGFPSFKMKMKVKEKFSIRLIRQTYKWLIKVDNFLKEREGKFTISQFASLGCEGCNIFLGDAFEITSPSAGMYRWDQSDDSNKKPKKVVHSFINDKDDDAYLSCASDPDDDDEQDLDSDELNDLVNRMNNLGPRPIQAKRTRVKRKGTDLGQMMGGMLGGMMQGLVGEMMGKDNIVYKIHKEKYGKLREYVSANRRKLTPKQKEDYDKMLKLMLEILKAYDKHEDNPLALTQEVNLYTKQLDAIKTPYPPGAGFNEDQYSGEALKSVLSKGEGKQECSVM